MKNILILISLLFLGACASTNMPKPDYINLSREEVLELIPFRYFNSTRTMSLSICISNGRWRYYNSREEMLKDATLMQEKKWKIYGEKTRRYLIQSGTKIIILEFDENGKVVSQKEGAMWG